MGPAATAPPRRAQNGGDKAAAAPLAFRIGAQPLDKVDFDNTTSTTTSTTDLPLFEVPPMGFLRGLTLWVIGTTAGNSATVTFAEDGPFNVFDSVTFEDPGGTPQLGPISGYELMLIHKYGGYAFSEDPRQEPIYAATTGSGATGGSFEFALHLPLELVARDALGSLPSKSGSAKYKLRLRLAATATIYGTPPTAAPSVRTRVIQTNWWDPQPTDLMGRPQAQTPPELGSAQYWRRESHNVNTAITEAIEYVGFPIRNLLFVLRRSSSTRANGESDWPDPLTLTYEGTQLAVRYKRYWWYKIARAYGYTGGTLDAAGARDNGVFIEPYNDDFGARPGQELRRGYLPTNPDTRLEVSGTAGNAGTLIALVNYVSPARNEVSLAV
jgi:hypothetical protein